MASTDVWKRRVLLMAIIGVLVAVPLTLLIRGGGGDGSEPSASSSAQAPEVGPVEHDRGLGVRYQVAGKWRDRKRSSAIRLRSPDRQAQIVIASPAPASETGAVLDEALTALRSGYENVDVNPGSGVKLGGLNTRGAVATLRTRKGVRLRVVVAVAKGDRRAYLVEVFTSSGVPPERVREAQLIMNSLEFLK